MGTLLWIHGKRAYALHFSGTVVELADPPFHSGIRKDRTLVR